MSIIILYLWIVLSTVALTILTKKKFEVVLPLTFILGTFAFYIGGFFEKVSLGLVFCLLLSLGAIPLAYLNRKDRQIICKNTFTVGFVVFTLFYLYFSFYHRFTAFSTWDEFQHWGPMIKETMRLDSFYSVVESTVQTHKDYPPIITMLQAMWCNLSRGYSEAYCYRALSIFTVSLFMPCFSKLEILEKKDWVKSILYAASILFVNLISFVLMDTLFTTIYIDYILGVYSAYVLYLAIRMDGKYSMFDAINLGFSLAFLIMVKQMAIAFYAMTLFVVFGLTLLNKEKLNLKRLVVYGVFFIVLPLVVSKSWEIYNAPLDLGWQFKISELSISDFLNLVFNKVGEGWQLEALVNYIEAINHRPLIVSNIQISYWWINGLLAVALFAVNAYFSKSIKKPAFVMITYIIGVVGYAVTMLMLYTFSFGSFEGPTLASFERYLNTYVYLGFCLVIMCLAWYSSEFKFRSTVISSLSLLLFINLFCGPGAFEKLKIQKEYTGYLTDQRYNYIFGQLESTLEDGDSVLVVSQFVDITVQILKYRYPQYKFQNVTLGSPKYPGEPFSVDYSLESWKDLYSQFDYVYLYNTDDEFYYEYWITVTDEVFLNMNMYHINDGSFCLISADRKCGE